MFRKSILAGCIIALLFTIQPGFGQTVFSEQDIISMVKNAPSLKEFPQAGAIILLNQKIININADGSRQVDLHLVIKMLTDRGKGRYGDQKFKYDIEQDSLAVLLARTFRADMSTMDVEAKAINDITPPEITHATVYFNLKQKVISFPALAPGTTIELKLRKITKAPEDSTDRHFWGADFFQAINPILQKELVLQVPEKWQANYVLANRLPEPELITEKHKRKYIWRVKNVSQIIQEPNMPPIAEIAPKVLYSSEKSWENVGQWFGKKFYEQVKTDEAFTETAAKITLGSSTEAEKIQRIFLFVATEIRSVYLNLGDAGYAPNSALDVLDNRYGDYRDKSVLLVSLLKAAGITAYPALLGTDQVDFIEAVPSPKQFNNLFVYIPAAGKREAQWLNPFAERCRYGYFPYGHGTTALVVKPAGAELLTVTDFPPAGNRSWTKTVMTLDAQGNVDGQVECQLDGYFDFRTRARLKYATPKEKVQFFQQAANSVGEGTLETKHELSDLTDLILPVKISQSFATPELGIVEGDMMIFRIPDVPFYFANLPFWPGLESRKYDFYANTKLLYQAEGELNLPENFKVAYLPAQIKVENEFGEFNLKFKLHKKASKITYESKIILSSTKIKKGKYAAFKKAFDTFSVPKNQLILLEQKI